MLYLQEGSYRLAEKTLLDAVKTDPLDHQSWSALGEVCSSLGELERSSECLITALDLQSTAPVLPFATLLPCFS
ncbi:Tetratricopeptide repeat [Trinorchestia longiramus]|nr:Tetratricopeptide repeat [Trinorchestia longiramus]